MDIAKEKEIFAKGIEQLKASGFKPADQMIMEGVEKERNAVLARLDMGKLGKMAEKWKKIDQEAEMFSRAKNGLPPTPQAPIAPVAAPQPQRFAPSPFTSPTPIMEQVAPVSMGDGDDDDSRFDQMIQRKFQQARQQAPQPQQQQYAPQYVAQQPAYQQPVRMNEVIQPIYHQPQQVQLINEGMIVEIAAKAVKQVLNEQFGEDFIKKVVLQTILTLKESSRKG